MIVSIRENEDKKKLISVTDADLVGKKFEDGKKQLDFTSEFYKGEDKSEEEVKSLLAQAYIIILSGKESVTLGINLGYLTSENVVFIQEIPHAQVILI